MNKNLKFEIRKSVGGYCDGYWFVRGQCPFLGVCWVGSRGQVVFEGPQFFLKRNDAVYALDKHKIRQLPPLGTKPPTAWRPVR